MSRSLFRLYLGFACTGSALLGGCVATGNAPSLAQRPFERAAPAATPAPTAAIATADSALASHLADLERESVAADASFKRLVPAVQRAVNGAGAAGSESWTDAQQQLSALEAERGPDTAALAELDETARTLEASAEPSAAAGLQAVAATVATIQARDDAHGREVQALSSRLPS